MSGVNNVVKGRVARQQRQEGAALRQAERDRRTPLQQIQKLLETGHGHNKETKRLSLLVPWKKV